MEPPITSVIDGITYETWMQDGHLHRVDGPAHRAVSLLEGRETPLREGWWLKGKRHRWGQAAYQVWNSQGIMIHQGWFIHGRYVVSGDDHQAANIIRRWFLYHRHRRERIISSLLRQDGMTVFPGLMELLRKV